MKIGMIAYLCALGLTAWLLTGCSSGTGWQFSIGVNPINGVDNKQALDPRVVQARSEQERKNY